MKRKSKRDSDDFFDDLINDEPVAPKPAVTKDGWPVNVPILTPEDVTWNYSTMRGRHDLAVWLELTFNPENPIREPKQYRQAYRTLCEVITERFKRPVTVLPLFLEFTIKNKLPCLAWQAACWNEMLHRLGYDVAKKKRADPGFKPKE